MFGQIQYVPLLNLLGLFSASCLHCSVFRSNNILHSHSIICSTQFSKPFMTLILTETNVNTDECIWIFIKHVLQTFKKRWKYVGKYSLAQANPHRHKYLVTCHSRVAYISAFFQVCSMYYVNVQIQIYARIQVFKHIYNQGP